MTIIYNEEKVNHIKGKSKSYKESRLLELMEKQKEIAEQVNFWVKDKLFDDEYFKEFVDDNLIFCGYILYCIKYEEELTYDEMLERGFKSVLSTSRQYVSNDTKIPQEHHHLTSTKVTSAGVNNGVAYGPNAS